MMDYEILKTVELDETYKYEIIRRFQDTYSGLLYKNEKCYCESQTVFSFTLSHEAALLNAEAFAKNTLTLHIGLGMI
jgi:hypothetical protein